MASVETRTNRNGTISYRVRFRLAGHYIAETFESERAAKHFADTVNKVGGAAALDVELARAESSVEPITVAQWVRTHIDGLSGVTAGTRSDYLSYVNLDMVTHPMGLLPVGTLDSTAVKKWVKYLHEERRLSTKSMKNRTGLLSAAMDGAVMAKIAQSNPCTGLRLPKTVTLKEMVFLSGEEFLTLVDLIGPQYEPLVTFLYATGVRWGEATALRVMDLDLDASPPMVRVSVAWKHTDGNGRELGPPKTKKSRRSISLPGEIVPTLRRITEGKAGTDLVFTNTAGHVISQGTFYSPWSVAQARLNQMIGKKPWVHDLRHSHASNLIAAGVPLNVIQYRLGHESITTTVDRYGHLAQNAQAIAAAAASDSLVSLYPQIEAPRHLAAVEDPAG